MLKKSKLVVLVLSLVLLFNFNVTVSAKDFSDLAKSSWAYKAVSEMSELGVIDGYTDGTFKPQNKVTRAEFAKLLVATLDLDEKKVTNPLVYEDVPSTHWAYKYVTTAGNYLTGYKVSNKLYFYPNNDAVREDMAVAMVVASGLSNVEYKESTLNKFKDINTATPSLKKYIAIAVEHGLMKGNSNGTFNAKGTLTRAEAAQLMLNFNNAEKISIEDLEKMLEQTEGGPILHEKYGYIDLGENYKDYQYSDDGTSWKTPTARYIHKSSNPKTGNANNFYGTDIQIRLTKDKNKVWSYKLPVVPTIDVELKNGKVDLGENWHAYDICTTDLETLSGAKSGSFKWVKAPEQVITKGSTYFNKAFLYVRYEASDKSSYTSDAVRVGDPLNVTWKHSDKVIEYTGTSYQITEEAGVYYVTVGAGKKSTGGYSIAIKDVHVDGRNVTLDVQQTVPNKNDMVTQVVNYPTATIEMNIKPEKVTLNKLPNITADQKEITWQRSTKVISYTGTDYKITSADGKIYLTVGAGAKKTTGYAIKIVDVHVNGSSITVDVQNTIPRSTDIVTTKSNYPVDTIELSGKPESVTINKLQDVYGEENKLTWERTDKVINYTGTSYKVTEEDGKAYVTVGAGKKNTGGYSIAIKDVHIDGLDVTLDVQETVPSLKTIVTQQINYPTATIAFNAKPKSITINKLSDIVLDGEQFKLTKIPGDFIEYTGTSYKLAEQDGKIYVVVGMGKKSGSGWSIDINDWGYANGNLDLYVQETIPTHPELEMTMPYYPVCIAELSIKPSKVTLHKMDPKYYDDYPGLTEKFWWDESSTQIKRETSGYQIDEKNGNIYLTVGLGQRNTGGYSVKITDVKNSGSDITVTYQEYAPGPYDMTTQALTYPSDTVQISMKPNKVTLNALPVIRGDDSSQPLTWKTTSKVINITTPPYKITKESGKVYLTVCSGPKSTSFRLNILKVNIQGKYIQVVAEEVLPDTYITGSASASASKFYACATIELSGEPSDVDVEIHGADPVVNPEYGDITYKEVTKRYNIDTKGYKLWEENGNVYLTLCSGMKNHGGYAVYAESMTTSGSTLNVLAVDASPDPMGMYTMALEAPQITYKLSKKPSKVNVSWKNGGGGMSYINPIYDDPSGIGYIGLGPSTGGYDVIAY